jgi:hypothetical protein
MYENTRASFKLFSRVWISQWNAHSRCSYINVLRHQCRDITLIGIQCIIPQIETHTTSSSSYLIRIIPKCWSAYSNSNTVVLICSGNHTIYPTLFYIISNHIVIYWTCIEQLLLKHWHWYSLTKLSLSIDTDPRHAMFQLCRYQC